MPAAVGESPLDKLAKSLRRDCRRALRAWQREPKLPDQAKCNSPSMCAPASARGKLNVTNTPSFGRGSKLQDTCCRSFEDRSSGPNRNCVLPWRPTERAPGLHGSLNVIEVRSSNQLLVPQNPSFPELRA